MSGGILKVVFKAEKDAASFASVIASIKSDVASLSTAMPDLGKVMSESMSNAQIDKMIDASGILGEKAGKSFSKKFKSYGMDDLAKIFSKSGPALPDVSAFLPKGSDKAIKGLRDITGKDLAKVQALPDINDLSQKMDKIKILVASVATLYNPFVGARLLSDAIPKDKMAGGKGITGAIFGAAGAAGYGEIFVVVKVLETAFKALVGSVKKVIEAYDNATKLYAKSLMTGLGLQFVTKRQNIASVLGVDETQIFRFGAALAYLTPQLAFANEEISKTAIPLTGIGWQFKILGMNIKAIWAQIASALAPAFGAFLENLNSFFVTLGKSQILKAFASALDVVLIVLNDVIGAIEIFVNAFVTGFKIIADAISIAIMKILNLVSKLPGLHKLGGYDTSKAENDITNSAFALNDEIKKYLGNFFGSKTATNIPPPISQMKQLPAGAFEKMGLIIGGGLADKSLELQRRTAMGIEKLVEITTGSKTLARQSAGFYMNRSQFVNGY